METTFMFRPFAWLKSLWDTWMHNREVTRKRRETERKLLTDKQRLEGVRENITRLRKKIENSGNAQAREMATATLKNQTELRDTLMASLAADEAALVPMTKRAWPKFRDYFRLDIVGIAKNIWSYVLAPVLTFVARFGYIFIIAGYLVAHYGYHVATDVLMPYYWMAAIIWIGLALIYSAVVYHQLNNAIEAEITTPSATVIVDDTEVASGSSVVASA